MRARKFLVFRQITGNLKLLKERGGGYYMRHSGERGKKQAKKVLGKDRENDGFTAKCAHKPDNNFR